MRLASGGVERARRLLLATGLLDELPPIKGLAELWGRGVFHCPYCHGFEVRDTPLALLMQLTQQVIKRLRAQAARPTGLPGRMVGWVLAHRSSNRRRNAWAVSLLDVQRDDRVLEIGFGPGVRDPRA